MANQIKVIAPYWLEEAGTWVFDDPKAGLEQEPFVNGIPEMIDNLVADIPNARRGIPAVLPGCSVSGIPKKTDPATGGIGRLVVLLG